MRKMKPKFNLRFFLKILISVWICYHLVVIAAIPNGNSFLGKRYQIFFLPYANSLVMNTSWNFFSPDPAHIMYIRYLVYKTAKPNQEEAEPEEYFYPEEKMFATSNLAKRRNLYVMRFLAINPERFSSFFVPWVCRNHPDAYQVFVEHKILKIPPYEEVIGNSQPIEELLQEMPYVSSTVPCPTDSKNQAEVLTK